VAIGSGYSSVEFMLHTAHSFFNPIHS
jgi:hypothetical protein